METSSNSCGSLSLSRASVSSNSRLQEGTVSSNSRFETVLFQQYSANLSPRMLDPSVSAVVRFTVLVIYRSIWQFRRFGDFNVLAVSPFVRFTVLAIPLALFRVPPSVLPLRPTRRFENSAFRFEGRAKLIGHS